MAAPGLGWPPRPDLTLFGRRRADLPAPAVNGGCCRRDGRLDPARRSRSIPCRRGGRAATGAGRPPGRGGWGRESEAAETGGGDGVVRGAGVRRPLGNAARSGRPQVPGRGVPALGSSDLRGGVVSGDDDAAILRGCGGSVGLGRGVRGRPHTAAGGVRPAVAGPRVRRDRAFLRGGNRGDETAGEDGDRVRQARGRRPADAAGVAGDDGRQAGHRHLGHRRAHCEPVGRQRHPHRHGVGQRRSP